MDKELLKKSLEKLYSIAAKDLSQEEIDLYRNHPLVKELNLTEQEFTSHFNGIKKMVDERLACDLIPDHCINDSNYHLVLKRIDEKLVYKSVFCPKMARLNASRFFAQNYLYRSFPNSFLDLSITRKYFGDINDPSKNELIKKFSKLTKTPDFKYGIYVYGTFGIGKTYTSIAFANDLARIGKKVVFCFVPDLVFNLKQGFDDKEANKKNIQDINKFMQADVLFLDDIGAEKTNAWFYSDHLMVLLNSRMQKNKPTFFTSNLSFEELQRKLIACCGQISGNRLAQRIIATTNGQKFKLEGPNLRIK